ncbi:hypothetical protein [Actinomadura monticuli]|uniref:Uncharacterized protein n=1 Tax=Actinomadura monticuli TaxID=3097367 RepID=A0ABV4QF42_9ACTN
MPADQVAAYRRPQVGRFQRLGVEARAHLQRRRMQEDMLECPAGEQ